LSPSFAVSLQMYSLNQQCSSTIGGGIIITYLKKYLHVFRRQKCLPMVGADRYCLSVGGRMQMLSGLEQAWAQWYWDAKSTHFRCSSVHQRNHLPSPAPFVRGSRSDSCSTVRTTALVYCLYLNWWEMKKIWMARSYLHV